MEIWLIRSIRQYPKMTTTKMTTTNDYRQYPKSVGYHTYTNDPVLRREVVVYTREGCTENSQCVRVVSTSLLQYGSVTVTPALFAHRRLKSMHHLLHLNLRLNRASDGYAQFNSTISLHKFIRVVRGKLMVTDAVT